MMEQQVFRSSKTSAAEPTSTLHVTAWSDGLSIPWWSSKMAQVEIWTEDDGGSRTKRGPGAVLKGPELAAFIGWLETLVPHKETL